MTDDAMMKRLDAPASVYLLAEHLDAALATPQDVMPAEAGTHDTFQARCALDDVERFDACVDPGLRRDDGYGVFAAEPGRRSR